jgi:hypothetical protein
LNGWGFRPAAFVYLREDNVGTQALLIELLLAGFFAIACFRARAEAPDLNGATPRVLFGLTNRLERLRRSRWQWFAILLLLFVVRQQVGAPLVAEFTALAQFILFLALPTQKISPKGALQKS